MRRRLSYANVVATLALFCALGGGAYAALTLPKDSVGPKQIKSKAVRSAEVKNRSLAPKDSKSGAIAGFAYVRDIDPPGDSTATVGYGRGVTGVDDANGVSTPYNVTFASSVRNCVVQAVPGAGKPYGNPDASWSVGHPATVDMHESFGPNTVQVYFRNSANGPVDTSFLITAVC